MQNSLHETPEGYLYFRDRANGTDVTVYEHQLNALLKYDAERVFDPSNEVHHVNRLRQDNRPKNLQLVDAESHADRHRADLDRPPEVEA